MEIADFWDCLVPCFEFCLRCFGLETSSLSLASTLSGLTCASKPYSYTVAVRIRSYLYSHWLASKLHVHKAAFRRRTALLRGYYFISRLL